MEPIKRNIVLNMYLYQLNNSHVTNLPLFIITVLNTYIFICYNIYIFICYNI